MNIFRIFHFKNTVLQAVQIMFYEPKCHKNSSIKFLREKFTTFIPLTRNDHTLPEPFGIVVGKTKI